MALLGYAWCLGKAVPVYDNYGLVNNPEYARFYISELPSFSATDYPNITISFGTTLMRFTETQYLELMSRGSFETIGDFPFLSLLHRTDDPRSTPFGYNWIGSRDERAYAISSCTDRLAAPSDLEYFDLYLSQNDYKYGEHILAFDIRYNDESDFIHYSTSGAAIRVDRSGNHYLTTENVSYYLVITPTNTREPEEPEPEEPEEPSSILKWKIHDSYVPKDTWMGSGFVVVDGKWVNCDAYAIVAEEEPEPEEPEPEEPAPDATPDNCLTFSSAEPFTIATANASKNWDGTLYYSTNGSTWSEWDGTTAIESAEHDGEQRLYMRGSGNTIITGDYHVGDKEFVLSGDGIGCYGNIESLLDYKMVENGEHPTMAAYCFSRLFFSCESLMHAPELPATTLTDYCYERMFHNCESLIQAPELPATNLARSCYYSMFSSCGGLKTAPKLAALTLKRGCYDSMFRGCTGIDALPELPATELAEDCYSWMFMSCASIKLSETQTGEYQTPYRIPTSGTGKTADGALSDMFTGTGGTFTGTPEINTTYYTRNTVV